MHNVVIVTQMTVKHIVERYICWVLEICVRKMTLPHQLDVHRQEVLALQRADDAVFDALHVVCSKGVLAPALLAESREYGLVMSAFLHYLHTSLSEHAVAQVLIGLLGIPDRWSAYAYEEGMVDSPLQECLAVLKSVMGVTNAQTRVLST
jgi:hypothetical protein